MEAPWSFIRLTADAAPIDTGTEATPHGRRVGALPGFLRFIPCDRLWV